jgi:hypothetical protein
MATEKTEKPELFDLVNLNRIIDAISPNVVLAEEVLDGDTTYSLLVPQNIEISSWIFGAASCRCLTTPNGYGKLVSEAMMNFTAKYEELEMLDCLILTIQDDIVDSEEAWRRILSTLLNDVHNYINIGNSKWILDKAITKESAAEMCLSNHTLSSSWIHFAPANSKK